jgi:hypothetical protein
MKRSSSSFWVLAAAPLALGTLGCQAGGVGDPCIPEDEYQNQFSGYSVTEVNVESRSFQCETRVCLVNHFQGRVSCPYGQTSMEIGKGEDPVDPADDDPNVLAAGGSWGNKCRIPGTAGERLEDRIQVPVAPQLYERRTSEAVYCSCRCANADGKTDDGARYCECPNGFSCEHLIDDVGLGSSQLAGSYCVKKGAEYDEALAETSPDCTLDLNYPGGWEEHPFQCGEAIP